MEASVTRGLYTHDYLPEIDQPESGSGIPQQCPREPGQRKNTYTEILQITGDDIAAINPRCRRLLKPLTKRHIPTSTLRGLPHIQEVISKLAGLTVSWRLQAGHPTIQRGAAASTTLPGEHLGEARPRETSALNAPPPPGPSAQAMRHKATFSFDFSTRCILFLLIVLPAYGVPCRWNSAPRLGWLDLPAVEAGQFPRSS